MAFCIIQKHFIRNIRVKFDIPNLPKSPDIRKNLDGVSPISEFMVNLL